MKELFPVGTLKPAGSPHPFPVGPSIELPDTFPFEGLTRPTKDFIHATDTSAILVLKEGEIRFEQYSLTGGPGVQWISWSVAKSLISALIGVAVEEGLISNIEDPIDGYVPVLAGSA